MPCGGKGARAAPSAQLCEQARVHHVGSARAFLDPTMPPPRGGDDQRFVAGDGCADAVGAGYPIEDAPPASSANTGGAEQEAAVRAAEVAPSRAVRDRVGSVTIERLVRPLVPTRRAAGAAWGRGRDVLWGLSTIAEVVRRRCGERLTASDRAGSRRAQPNENGHICPFLRQHRRWDASPI